ncbi:hypothetical protein EYF80_028571 [Liparis tanakae]|uniref:Uncharacterized protein n=1 Tax=Liparis tanakae TaxID=230148 RepID=A0A4Z2H626_9TELE|nr:hypothetical protein EYF80_028571 [Liparis tanakae]
MSQRRREGIVVGGGPYRSQSTTKTTCAPQTASVPRWFKTLNGNHTDGTGMQSRCMLGVEPDRHCASLRTELGIGLNDCREQHQ